ASITVRGSTNPLCIGIFKIESDVKPDFKLTPKAVRQLTPAHITVDLCGDGLVEEGEDCDGENLDGATCEDIGFDGGDLACTPDCKYDISHCFCDEVSPMCGDPTFIQASRAPTVCRSAPRRAGDTSNGLVAHLGVPYEGSLVRGAVPVFGEASGRNFH